MCKPALWYRTQLNAGLMKLRSRTELSKLSSHCWFRFTGICMHKSQCLQSFRCWVLGVRPPGLVLQSWEESRGINDCSALLIPGVWKGCRHLLLHRTWLHTCAFIYIISLNPHHSDGQGAFLPLYKWKGWGSKEFLWFVQEKIKWQLANDWELKAKAWTLLSSMVILNQGSGPGSEAWMGSEGSGRSRSEGGKKWQAL